jgi:phage-related protein
MSAAVKSSETDASARQWKPPPTFNKLTVTSKQSKAKTGMLNEVMDFFGM